MKTLNVVAAIIINQDRILIAQRSYGPFKGLWEFPGGKIEDGESKEDALKREIKEELKLEISVDRYLTTINYDYQAFHLTMDCFICSIKSGKITLTEHEKYLWVNKNELDNISWLDADRTIIELIKESIFQA